MTGLRSTQLIRSHLSDPTSIPISSTDHEEKKPTLRGNCVAEPKKYLATISPYLDSDVKIYICHGMSNGNLLVKKEGSILQILNSETSDILAERTIPLPIRPEWDDYLRNVTPLFNKYILCSYLGENWLLDANNLYTICKVKGAIPYGPHSATIFDNYLILPLQHRAALYFRHLERFKTKIVTLPLAKEAWINAIIPIAKNQLAIALSNKTAIYNYDPTTQNLTFVKELITTASGFHHSITRLINLPNEKFITLENKEGGKIKLWDAKTLACIRESNQSLKFYCYDNPELLPDGVTLIAKRSDGKLCLINAENLTSALLPLPENIMPSNFHKIRFTILANGKIVLSLGETKLFILELDPIRDLILSKVKDNLLSLKFLDADVSSIILSYVDDVNFNVPDNLGKYSMSFFRRTQRSASTNTLNTFCPPIPTSRF